MLTKALISSFSSRVRSRGGAYAMGGRVEILRADEEAVEASVHGSERYDVFLEHDPDADAIFGSCTCPYFEDRFEPCKHLWATVVVGQRQGLLQAAVRAGVCELVPMDPAAGSAYESPPSLARSRNASGMTWQRQLDQVAGELSRLTAPEDRWSRDRQILYRFDVNDSVRRDQVAIDLLYRDPKKNGDFGKVKHGGPSASAVPRLSDGADRLLLSMVAGATDHESYPYDYADGKVPRSFGLPNAIQATWLRLAAESGRLLVADTDGELSPLEWVGDPPSALRIEVVENGQAEGAWMVRGHLEREGERTELARVRFALSGGLYLEGKRLGMIEGAAAMPWLGSLSRLGAIVVPKEDEEAFVERLIPLVESVALALPDRLRYEEVTAEPQSLLRLTRSVDPWRRRFFRVSLLFDYLGLVVDHGDPRAILVDATARRVVRRQKGVEAQAAARLRALGVREEPNYGRRLAEGLEISAAKMDPLIETLAAEGWWVEVEGTRHRSAGDFSLSITSGVDWFDLEGEATFDGVEVALPALLAAVAKQDSHVVLADGSVGLVPEDWRRRLMPLLALGTKSDEGVRFARSQLAVIDALLAIEPEISADRALTRAREKLTRFETVRPLKAPSTFRGTLRGYQEEGLAWLRFLDRLGLGGCLADDMGLGKTVQVLAWLAKRRASRRREERRPSLVVVPRSLIGNWSNEAARFVPVLRILEHAGADRSQNGDAFADYDLVITTYGLVRRDIVWLRGVTFDYAILDEAQAIKNAKTATAKAVRLLSAHRRLALSGTPVENHPGELLSLFDFLNPGLFGQGRGGFSRRRLEKTKDPDDPALRLLARSVRPLMLRRRKEQVAKDLPPKVEETLRFELPGKQRREYDRLRDYYRAQLMASVDSRGLARSKIMVLEALLRLRQMACHPGLIDKARRHESSAKLELLLERLEEVRGAGHKALVFSQFTSLLGIVRDRLDGKGIPYAYLDGRTRKRQECVDRFQRDPACPFFLISLKAGGLGLNLTAAEYVFLLDPWWNPAVEVQAIDRTHRIGQTSRVFAYRLIATDTVEEKVVELQRTKKALADALVTADRSMLRNLTRDELSMLLT